MGVMNDKTGACVVYQKLVGIDRRKQLPFVSWRDLFVGGLVGCSPVQMLLVVGLNFFSPTVTANRKFI